MPIDSTDVLIIGLGPAGSATATHLARAGIGVTAIDRAVFPRDKVCSEYLSPEAVRHLAGLGVLAEVEARGVPLLGATVFGPRGARLEGRFGEACPSPFRPAGLSVPRKHLDYTLMAAARSAGARVLDGTALVELGRSGPGQRATVRRDGQLTTIEARLVIGADGLRSAVARALGGRRRRTIRRYGFVAHVAEVTDMGPVAEMHVGQSGYLGLNAIGGGLTNVAVVVPAATARRAIGDPDGFWADSLAGFPAVAGRVRPERVERRVLVSGPFDASARRVIGDGLALVGDAAEFFDPFTGEGVCAALRGAELLAPVAIAALGLPGPVSHDRLLPYHTARRQAFGGKWMVERMIGYGMLWPALFDRAVSRLSRRNLGHTLIGVTGDFVPPGEVLRPGFLAAMVV